MVKIYVKSEFSNIGQRAFSPRTLLLILFYGYLPKEWIVDCSRVGKGITAVKYLSRYLCRGSISEKNIVSNKNGEVTFKYYEIVDIF